LAIMNIVVATYVYACAPEFLLRLLIMLKVCHDVAPYHHHK
jgi:hypothetical protein